MKNIVKSILEKLGIRLNLVKNLWYLDSFIVLKNRIEKTNPVIFDVGACDGSSVEIFKKLFPESEIYSFEPYPASFNNLKEFSRKKEKVKVYQFALTNISGQMDFYVNKSKATNSLLKPKKTWSFIDEHAILESNIKVTSKTLDSFIQENGITEIDILKLDVQGGELMVFEGAEIALREKKIKVIYTEIWFIEGYMDQPLYHDIAAHLSFFGYYPFGIYNLHFRKDGHFLWGDAIFYLK